MLEKNPQEGLSESELAPDYAYMVGTGYKHAAATVDFNLQDALIANYGQNADEAATVERAGQVMGLAAQIAEDLRIDPKFFSRPANVILLMGVADSWLMTDEKIAATTGYNAKLSEERRMLVDVVLQVAGEQSGFVRDQASFTPSEAENQILHKNDAKKEQLTVFLQNTTDVELSAQMKELFDDGSEASLLHAQRAQLGLTRETEHPFTVSVLQVGRRSELQAAGLFSQAGVPKDKQALVDSYEHNQQLFSKFFNDKTGGTATAFVSTDQYGNETMFLRAPQALALIEYAKHGFTANLDVSTLKEAQVIVCHEYVHTQKSFLLNSLGFILEERKAELLAGDYSTSYKDIKFLISDLSAINDVLFLKEGMSAALLQQDALSTLLAWSAKNLGLRNTTMLMASRPKNYDNTPGFVNNRAIKSYVDLSAHDAMLREALDRKGDTELRAYMAAYVGRTILTKGVHARLALVAEIQSRRKQRISYTTRYLKQAMEGVVFPREPELVDFSAMGGGWNAEALD